VNIYVSKSKITGGGRGVFASTEIKKGETIEICPIIELPSQELSRLDESILLNYVYFFGKDKQRILLALGFGSIYNHSYTPNGKYKINSKENTIQFIAIKNIKKGDEITVSYKGNLNSAPLWFEV
jgi:uncharacterized protein